MINLLPYKEKKSIERIRAVRLLRTIAVGFVAALLIAGALLFPTLVTINSRFNIATNQVQSLENNGAMASEVDITSLDSRAQLVQAKLSSVTNIQPTEYIGIVKTIIPVGIIVDRFSTSTDKILEVSGVAESREVLQLFVNSLEKNQQVASVDSPVSNFIKNTNSVFKITVLFK